MEREKGQDVASAPCPNCGTSLRVEAQADGSLAHSTCQRCYGVKPEKAAAAPSHREKGTSTVSAAEES